MDEQLNQAPFGFLTLSRESIILSVNQTLLRTLGYRLDELHGQHVDTILSVPAKMFYQLYFFPLIKVKQQVEELYLSLESKDGQEVPVLVNASLSLREGHSLIDCAVIPMRKRNAYENELLIAKKDAEAALIAKKKVNAELEVALQTLEMQKEELYELNIQNQKYKVDTEKELELARKIQETSLSEPISNEYLQIEAFYQASSKLSGDMYGIYQITPHRYGIIILDVMGHGISSSLVTMSLQSLFQRLISKEGYTVDMVMKELDNHLHSLFQNNEETRHYCTAIYLLIDTEKREIEYCNAGHPSALWQEINGTQHSLQSATPPLGTFEGISFQTSTVTYTAGSRLLLFTDGVEDPLGEKYLARLLLNNLTNSIYDVKKDIIETFTANMPTYAKNDDKCFILIDFK